MRIPQRESIDKGILHAGLKRFRATLPSVLTLLFIKAYSQIQRQRFKTSNTVLSMLIVILTKARWQQLNIFGRGFASMALWSSMIGIGPIPQASIRPSLNA